MTKFSYLSFLFVLITFVSCNSTAEELAEKPNVILIMADDMGYECLSCYGSASYSTPVLDQLASEGIRFDNCISQPLCTPSRVKIMTGQYNYRNYSFFGHLQSNQFTFGNLMKDAGYSTCIAGKWQLNGLSYKDQIEAWNDNTRPNQFGFDEYCLWQLTNTRAQGGRYSSPTIEKNGEVIKLSADDYGPDQFSNYVLDFIERKKDQPFFVYYPMVLIHDPFVPTPDSETWNDKSISYKNNKVYIKDMIAYTDKIVGKIVAKLKALEIDDNTIVIFTGDNGTHYTITSEMINGSVKGGKGNTTDAGTHVPLIVSWPKNNKGGLVYNELIEFSDFFATFADIVETETKTDGQSFLPLLTSDKHQARETAFVNYDPKWGKRVTQFRNRFVRDLNYKLYQDGKFYKLSDDILEQSPLHPDSLSVEQISIKKELEAELSKHPKFE